MQAESKTRIVNFLSRDVAIAPWQAEAVIELFEDGATVPFIARYRKERTGQMDDTQLRVFEEKYLYYTTLEDRRQTVLEKVSALGKLTPELEAQILACDTKQGLEDIYLPFRPKRRSIAADARENGLEPLLEEIISDTALDVSARAADFIRPDTKFDSADGVLKGVRALLAERIGDNAFILGSVREMLWREAELSSKVIEGMEQGGETYKDYFEYRELISKIPSHRALALLRGFRQGVLRVGIDSTEAFEEEFSCLADETLNLSLAAHKDAWLKSAVGWAWRVKILPGMESELISLLREDAEKKAIDVFGTNLKAVLMAAPVGSKVVMGLDPGYRNGVKIAVVSGTGALLETFVVHPFQSAGERERAQAMIARSCLRHGVEFLAIGNGTASRETDELVGGILAANPAIRARKVIVSEAGASVYSASEVAAQEFPDVDVSFRGAISIARRLQDPLAELVKIDPKAIGVGQYQHDLNEELLNVRLNNVVEDCVNAVGVDINTASADLLRRVVGIGPARAANVIELREKLGGFTDREQIRDVRQLGEKRFAQCVGFLRINNGKNPLDATSVHPESYPVVEKMLRALGKPIGEVIGNTALLKTLRLKDFVTDTVGMPTLEDIVRELEKPARDPRAQFTYANFNESIHKISDLSAGMKLEGVVTNVAQFGAFVDIGVHQDGLVHISELSDDFVKDPHQVVRVGDIVQVVVLEVDEQRKRISLSMKKHSARSGETPQGRKQGRQGMRKESQRAPTAMSNAFQSLGMLRK